MKAIITVQMDHAAFAVEDEEGEYREDKRSGTELARVLRRLASQLEDDTLAEGDTSTARDTNGNPVAELEITEDLLIV